ncbi:MAG: SusD/RagB family nutrient-binding outer membrane lipoprotein [Chitinophagaceae bacterium]
MKPLFIFIALFFLLGFMSCEKMVAGLNDNPNNPTNASAELILTGLQLGNIAFHEGHTARIAGIWSGYFSGVDRQYRDYHFYVASGFAFSTSWQDVYYGVLQQEKLLEARAKPVNNRLLTGIGKVIKAHAVGTAAACWGDVPFSQVGDIEQFPQPAFDPQLNVYEGVQLLLNSAIEDLTSGIGTSPGVADIHFGGKAASWIEAAHTLKARFYQDVRKYDKAYDEALLGIKSAANSMVAPHATATGTQNFYSTGRSTTDITSEGAYITNLLDPAHDAYKGNSKTDERARLNYYFTYTTTNGVKSKFIPNTTLTVLKKGIFAQTASYSLITYQENLLILAEAGLRAKGFAEGLKNLNAYRAYMNTGGYINASYLADGLKYSPYAESDFLENGMINKTGAGTDEALLKEILRERYVTFFGEKLGFHDIRRTRKETAGVKVPTNIGTVLPERFIYSQDEINSNTSLPKPLPGIFDPTTVNK